MPGGTQDVRPEDASLGEGGLDVLVRQARSAQAEGPFRRRVVLRLDGAQPGDDVGWMTCPELRRRADVRLSELVTVQPPLKDAVRRYRFASSNASTSFDER